MLLLVMAIAAMHLFTAVLAMIPAGSSDQDPFAWARLGEFRLSCWGYDTKPAGGINFLKQSIGVFGESQGTDARIHLPSGYCTQIACKDSSAILFCRHPHKGSIIDLDKSVSVDLNKIKLAARQIMDSCLVNVPIGRVVHHHVNGQLFYDEELSSVVITQQECYGINEMTQGLGDGDPVPMDKDDPPAPSATTKAEHTPTASEAASTTSAHSTKTSRPKTSRPKTSRPKSQKTASPEPPTTTHKASDTDIKRPTDQDWLLTTCFSDSHDGAVYSHKIVQDNIDWIVANVEKVPRNPGKGNCIRLACHRNSAIFFCNDDGDLHSDLENPDQIVDGARKIVSACRVELDGKTILGNGYVDMIAGEINHKDNWRVVVQSSLCDAQTPGDQIPAQIAPEDNTPKSTQSGKDKKTKSEPRSSINKAIDFLRPKVRDNDLTIRGAIRAARACKASAPTNKRVVRRDPPPGYVRHSCWGSLKNASFPSPIEAGIYYLNTLDGRPGINAGKCDQVSCSWDTAISWCSTNLERFELDSFKQIAAGAQFILDNCDVPADTCWVGHDISGQVWFKDKWSVVVSGSLEHC